MIRWPIRMLLGGLLVVTLGLLAMGAARAAGDSERTVEGYTIYLGVLPAGVLFLYRPGHGDPSGHGGPRFGDAHHMLVGLVDAASGIRIGDADITAWITPAKGPLLEKRLEPMSVDKTVAHGGFFPLRRDHRYRIDLTIRRPGTTSTVEASFDYTHRF